MAAFLDEEKVNHRSLRIAAHGFLITLLGTALGVTLINLITQHLVAK